METLYEFWENDSESIIKTGQVAKAMNVSPASATEMIQRLAGKGLVEYIPYKGLKLTEKGLVTGGRMKKRHRLAECLLIDVLGFTGDAHKAACMLEHALTDELEESLDYLLGRPTKDPSGRNIPRSFELNLEIDLKNSLKIATSLDEGEEGVLVSISMTAEERMTLAELGIETGKRISRTSTGLIIDSVAHELDELLLNRILISIRH